MLQTAAKHKPITIAISIIFTSVVISLLSQLHNYKGGIEQAQTTGRIEVYEYYEHLVDNLQKDLGYGGFIHHFNNLIMQRGYERGGRKIDQDIKNIRADISQLESISEIATIPEKPLLAIKKVAEEYFAKYKILKEKTGPYYRIGAIEKLMKVDDEPALRGLAELQQFIQSRKLELSSEIHGLQASAIEYAKLSNVLLFLSVLVAA